jgi:hypothetical protein
VIHHIRASGVGLGEEGEEEEEFFSSCLRSVTYVDGEYQIAVVVGHFLLRCLRAGFTVCDIRFGF